MGYFVNRGYTRIFFCNKNSTQFLAKNNIEKRRAKQSSFNCIRTHLNPSKCIIINRGAVCAQIKILLLEPGELCFVYNSALGQSPQGEVSDIWVLVLLALFYQHHSKIWRPRGLFPGLSLLPQGQSRHDAITLKATDLDGLHVSCLGRKKTSICLFMVRVLSIHCCW